MAKTRHLQSRMNQRGINQEILELTLQFGIADGDHTVLSGNQIKALISELDGVRRKAVKALDKGGVVVVTSSDGESLITTYALDSFRRKAS